MQREKKLIKYWHNYSILKSETFPFINNRYKTIDSGVKGLKKILFSPNNVVFGSRGTSNYDILAKPGFGSFFSIHMQSEMSVPNIKLTVNLVLPFLLNFIPLTFKSLTDLENQSVSEIKYTWWHFKSNILIRRVLYNSADCLRESSYKSQQTWLSYEVTGKIQVRGFLKIWNEPHGCVSRFKWI